ncbi:MAG: hypothetical protein KJ888_20320, partial [Gammaproteobacteria bacterium]|nr:hypothetical protein [Gammaproteobacteria bacterium]
QGMETNEFLNVMRARKGLPDVQFTPQDAKVIGNMASMAFNGYSTSTFWRMYDKAQNWWKGWQILPWPAFWGRNAGTDVYKYGVATGDGIAGTAKAMSRIHTNMGEGRELFIGKIAEIATDSGDIISGSSMKQSLTRIGRATGMSVGGLDDIMKGGAENPASLTWYQSVKKAIMGFTDPETGLAAKDISVGERAKRIGKAFVSPHEFPISKIMYEGFGQKWETAVRWASYIELRKQGWADKAALEHTLKWMIDYNDLSMVEKEWGKRLIPFYTWQRKQIPLTFQTLVQKPMIYDTIYRTQRALQGQFGSEVEEEVLPAYIRDMTHFRFPTAKGEIPQYLVSLGLPEEDMLRLMSFTNGPLTPLRAAMSQLGPFLKVPIELGTGKILYFDKPISDFNRAHGYLKHLPDTVKKFINFHEYTDKGGNKRFMVNPYAMYAMSQFRAFAEVDDYLDDRKGALSRMLNAFTGAKVAEVDINIEARRRIREYAINVAKEWKDAGLLREFEKYYIPKDLASSMDELPEDLTEALELLNKKR